MLKVPVDEHGFFLEAHVKLRPLDFATDGIYLCGSARFPSSVGETISQAQGAAAGHLATEGIRDHHLVARLPEHRQVDLGRIVDQRLASPLVRAGELTWPTHSLQTNPPPVY